MSLRFPAALVAALALLGAGPALGDTFELDTQHTEVRFTWDHLGLSRQGGRFDDVHGVVTFDAAQPAASTISVTIPVKSISTGVKKLDDHLTTSKEFFDVAAHPNITFKSTTVTPTSDQTANVVGDLTINGIAKPVTLEVQWNFTGEHPLSKINPTYAGAYYAGFSATTQFVRSEWGITRTIPFVSDELKITIETEMKRTGAATATVPMIGTDIPGPPASVTGSPEAAPPPATPLPPDTPPTPGDATLTAPPDALPPVIQEGDRALPPSGAEPDAGPPRPSEPMLPPDPSTTKTPSP